MVQITFTAHLRALANTSQADGATVGEAIGHVFAANPRLKGYVLDEQGALRRHVCIFLDGERLPNASALTAPVTAGSEIYVMQALSGG